MGKRVSPVAKLKSFFQGCLNVKVLLGLCISVCCLHIILSILLQQSFDTKQVESETWRNPMRRVNPSIPFYLYDDQVFQDLQNDCNVSESRIGGKHSDYYFERDLKKHPWRVLDPNDALLFVVPIPWARVYYRFCPNSNTLLPKIVKALESSPHWKYHQGNDHMSLSSHYIQSFFLRNSRVMKDREANQKLRDMVHMMITTDHILIPGSFCRFVAPYAVKYDPSLEADLYSRPSLRAGTVDDDQAVPRSGDFYLKLAKTYMEKRKYTFGFVGQADNRRAYKARRVALEQLPGFMSPNILIDTLHRRRLNSTSFPLCTEGGNYEGCAMAWTSDNQFFDKAITESRYCLFFRGDDWASQRLYDCVSAGTVIVIISNGLLDRALTLQCDVDWDLMAVDIPQSEFLEDPRGSLSRYLPDTATTDGLITLGKRINAVHAAKKNLLFKHPQSKTTELILIDAVRKCFPEALIRTYHYEHRQSEHPAVKSSLSSQRDLTCRYHDLSQVIIDPKYRGRGFRKYW